MFIEIIPCTIAVTYHNMNENNEIRHHFGTFCDCGMVILKIISNKIQIPRCKIIRFINSDFLRVLIIVTMIRNVVLRIEQLMGQRRLTFSVLSVMARS